MPNKVTLSGWREFETKLAAMPDILGKEIGGEVESAAKLWASLAKRAAPVDKGFLKGQITSSKVQNLMAEATSPVEYSAYQEWGTGSRAIVPADLSDYAAQWWTHRIHVGIRPHAYFFVQVPAVERELKLNVQRILNTEH